jgi:hypothetical protein
MTTQSQVIPLSSQLSSQTLWERALATIDSDLQAAVDFKSITKKDVAAAALRTAKEKRDICLRKRWKYRKWNGKDLIVRDLLDKIVGFLDKFIAIGDVAMQYDPAHAALPWAGVRFLLRVGKNEFISESLLIA